MSLKLLRYAVYGKVQGVFFRDSTVECANTLGVAGWVQNNSDGSVGGEAIGEPEPIEKLYVAPRFHASTSRRAHLSEQSQEWLKQGPRHARVTELKADLKDVEIDHFKGVFERRRGRGVPPAFFEK